MSDEAKETMTPQEQEAEDVAAFLMLRRTGAAFEIDYRGAWLLKVNGVRSNYCIRLTDAVQKLAERLPDVFDPAKGE